jgi:hypothetical protein
MVEVAIRSSADPAAAAVRCLRLLDESGWRRATEEGVIHWLVERIGRERRTGRSADIEDFVVRMEGRTLDRLLEPFDGELPSASSLEDEGFEGLFLLAAAFDRTAEDHLTGSELVLGGENFWVMQHCLRCESCARAQLAGKHVTNDDLVDIFLRGGEVADWEEHLESCPSCRIRVFRSKLELAGAEGASHEYAALRLEIATQRDVAWVNARLVPGSWLSRMAKRGVEVAFGIGLSAGDGERHSYERGAPVRIRVERTELAPPGSLSVHAFALDKKGSVLHRVELDPPGSRLAVGEQAVELVLTGATATIGSQAILLAVSLEEAGEEWIRGLGHSPVRTLRSLVDGRCLVLPYVVQEKDS